MSDQAAETTSSRPARPLAVLLLLVVGVMFLFHAVGASTAVIIIVCVVLGLVGLVVLRFLPNLRRHFGTRRSSRRSRTARSSTRQRRASTRTPRRLGAGGRARSRRSAAATGRRNNRPPRSTSRLPRGGSGARRLGRSPVRRPSGGRSTSPRRSPRVGGAAMRRRARLAKRTNGAGRGPGANRSSRRHTPRGRGSQRAQGQRASRRRLLRPSTWGGRNRPNSTRRPGGSKQQTRRRLNPFKPSTWRPSARRPAGQGKQPRRRNPIRRLTHRPSGQTRRGPFGAVARRMQARRARRAKARNSPLGATGRLGSLWILTRRKAGSSSLLRRVRRKGRRVKAKPGGAIDPPKPVAKPPAAAPPAPTLNGSRPAAPAAKFIEPTTTRGASSMTETHPAIDPISDAIQERLTPYEPQGPLEWLAFMKAHAGMFDTFASSEATLGDKLASDFPTDPAVADMWADMAASLRGLVDHVDAMAQKFEQDPRVQRALNPQTNERVLDVQNDD